MPKKRNLRADDLYALRVLQQPQFSPDGARVVYSLHQVNRTIEKKYANLWIAPASGGEPEPMTQGEHLNVQPRWSPDMQTIAFLSNRSGQGLGLYLLPMKGGEPRPILSNGGSVVDFRWSPTGDRIVAVMRRKASEPEDEEAQRRLKEFGPASRRVTRMLYKADGLGYLPEEGLHLWVVVVATGDARQITDHPIANDTDPCWTPDGTQIVFCSNRSNEPHRTPGRVDLFVAPAKGGKARRLRLPLGLKEKPSLSPDGRWLAYVGQRGEYGHWKQGELWLAELDSPERTESLTEGFDIDVSPWTYSDVGDHLPLQAPQWSPDGRRLYFQVTRHGTTDVCYVEPHARTRKLETLIATRGAVGAFAFDRGHQSVAYFHIGEKNPGDVYVRAVRGTRERPLGRPNEALLEGIDLGELEEHRYTSRDGLELQGWILKPPGFRAKRRYPSILSVHGGPYVQHGRVFMFEFYYWAAQGFVVHFCNLHGGQGYGRACNASLQNDWGSIDYDDVMRWTDYVSAQPFIDSKRMGITGGSYGGYMTNWVTSHTDRFAAAVTQRSVCNLVSIWGSSDINWQFQLEFGDLPPWANFENLWRMSPLAYVDNVTTPTLVVIPEKDERAPMEQSAQWYTALKYRGVETEMVIIPSESHSCLRAGRTDRRIARLEAIAEWFTRYLKP